MKTDIPFRSKEEVDKWYREAVDGLGALLALEVLERNKVKNPSDYLACLGYLKTHAECAYELLGVKEKFRATEINSFTETNLVSKPASMGM